MKLDILAFGAHPDDVELCAGGTVAHHTAMGDKVGIVDFTQGEMGTRGTPELRLKEAQNAAEIMGVAVRENLGFKDVFFKNDDEHKLRVVEMIRKYKPEIVLANAFYDRHPDHGKASSLTSEACFIAGLHSLKTTHNGQEQEAWRPKAVYHYIQGWLIMPDFIVDVSDFWEKKMDAIKAYRSQFHDPESDDPETWLSSPEFFDLVKGRSVEFGQVIGKKYGEGFLVERIPGVGDLKNLL